MNQIRSMSFTQEKSYAVLLVILCAFALQGCMLFAVAPLATSVMVGAAAGTVFFSYKTFQLSTGGSLEVRFKEMEVSASDRETLREIKRLAVLPGSSVNIKITEELMRKTIYEVMTPAQVTKILQADQTVPFDTLSAQLTEADKVERLKDLAAKIHTDAILVYDEEPYSAGGADFKFWSFKRGEIKTGITVKIFSSKSGRFVLKQPGEIVTKLGSSTPSQEEIQKLTATSVVDKLVDYLKPKSTKSEVSSAPLPKPETAPIASSLAPKETQAAVFPPPVLVAPPPKPEAASPAPSILAPKEAQAAVTPPPAPAVETKPVIPGKPPITYLVTTKIANVRSEPNAKSKILTTLKKGEKAEKLDKSGNWLKIKLTSGDTGWVFKDLVKEAE